MNISHCLAFALVLGFLTCESVKMQRQMQDSNLHCICVAHVNLSFMILLIREHAPSIIFMDEIDSIGSSRLEGGSGGGHYNIKLVNTGSD